MPLEARPFKRRPLSMTSLIDVIFLLLLYFMLSSTFQRHGELVLVTGTAGTGAPAPAPATQTLFLQLRPDALTLNGRSLAPADLPAAIAPLLPQGDSARAILSLDAAVDAQALTDVLVVLRGLPGLTVEVIG